MIERIVVGLLYTNAYIYSEWKKECLVIDPGEDADKILSHLTMINMKPRGIVFTHGHLDHILAAKQIKENYEQQGIAVPLAVHEKDLNYFGKNAGGVHKQSFSGLPPEEIHFFQETLINLPEIDIILHQGDYLFDSSLQVIHTPGHTPGGICLYSENEGTLISGDTLFFEGVGRTDLPGGDYNALIKSIKEKIFTLPETTRIFPGHGPFTTLDREIRNNPFVR